MKENVRRIIMFCTILTFGLILIFFDVTLVQLLLMMVVIAVVLPFLLGLVTIAEVRVALGKSRSKKPKKGDTKKPEIKKPETKKPLKAGKTEAGKTSGQMGGIGAHVGSFISSLGSLGTVLRQRKGHKKKVDDINRMLDKAVTEKVPVPAPAVPGGGAGTAPGGGAGLAIPVPSGEADPFLSLSGEEFDAGLLDGLDDINAPVASPEEPAPGGAPVSSAPETELSMPSLDIPAGSEGELKTPAPGGLEEFSSLDSGESLDSDFGDLDNLSLDDVETDVETGVTGPVVMLTPTDAGEGGKVDMNAEPVVTGSTAVKTAWIPSDAPKDASFSQDQISTQSDMASFAGGATGTDEDLLSSISSDVKHVAKKKDFSLLRELKDFKAPASDIESELSDMYAKLKADEPKEKTTPPTNK